MPVISAAKFQRFFRIAAGLNVDKDDLKRYSDFVNQKIYDLLIVARASAKANGRDIINPLDLPIIQGLQQSTTTSTASTRRSSWSRFWTSLRGDRRWARLSPSRPRPASQLSWVN